MAKKRLLAQLIAHIIAYTNARIRGMKSDIFASSVEFDAQVQNSLKACSRCCIYSRFVSVTYMDRISLAIFGETF